MGGKDVVDAILRLIQFVIDIQNLAAGITKYIRYALLNQCFNNNLRAGHHLSLCCVHSIPPTFAKENKNSFISFVIL